ncbi:hypothetical protein A2276_00350 [candidate division WOR-1 bacterium RIFOXYA12_FULL_43_27]|uniref:Glutamate--tRNA ligase n=1 Tax=candidate division WOR-1 bacterium RIFOXYC2_FULL_46_14 TaxID=1802587 RepID=A0A1F4U4B2_UNCSA|nr:MAG: hypothetical protein A2276_00350 [candidate division WOR-1 bacterium RIFOXYA12_FULL_43_27]OGC20853.1 MAG: hypothetical protein A2292_07525 [candidate division WOR-1 bacterium RIFOXYB2_FULL_46_45]OGC31409.1 MAG: hypothetical protein A2232_03920 [candidate division WOR-1 bacterium RIFOXYA2_FULL_46_56]OGC39815.1 MAG: hypothetical protein A2438_04755 [candidate division WOR-1 bacterium RIFOXYC2_FULL_46_14]
MSVKVRFAPSPTGALHLGGARTALFNWLYARGQNGLFILRIEDTDKERSTKEAVNAIYDGMRWLGLDWDEEPYHQTDRLEIYRKYADELLAAGKAFRDEGAIRFKLPQGVQAVVFDLLRDKVEFESDVLDNFVILKSDGFPTYNFACVIDDHLMEITHVIRGDDHLSNTPRQLLVYEALGFKPPKFAHIPMILGADGTRLSKRHGATSVIEYEKLGYLPDAMFNYLARLGWGYKDQEIFSRDELVKKFTIKAISKNPAKFDFDKLKWLNGQYIRKALPERIIDLCLPYLTEAYGTHDFEYVSKVVRLFLDRLVLTAEIVPLAKYFFTDDYEVDPAAVEKYSAPKVLAELKARLEKVDPFTKENIEPVFKSLATDLGLKLGDIIHPCRVALTGTASSPPMYDVIEVLGKERVLNRLGAGFKPART